MEQFDRRCIGSGCLCGEDQGGVTPPESIRSFRSKISYLNLTFCRLDPDTKLGVDQFHWFRIGRQLSPQVLHISDTSGLHVIKPSGGLATAIQPHLDRLPAVGNDKSTLQFPPIVRPSRLDWGKDPSLGLGTARPERHTHRRMPLDITALDLRRNFPDVTRYHAKSLAEREGPVLRPGVSDLDRMGTGYRFVPVDVGHQGTFFANEVRPTVRQFVGNLLEAFLKAWFCGQSWANIEKQRHQAGHEPQALTPTKLEGDRHRLLPWGISAM